MAKTVFGAITAEVIRSERKTISIQIKDGAVTVRAPRNMSEGDIRRFVEQKSSWIEKHLAASLRLRQEEEALEPFTAEEIRQLAARAAVIIPERVHHYAPLVGVDYGRITIRCQRSRWGSCSAKGNLNFNCLLVLAPPEVLDSVVVHELCHRKQMNHSPSFYAEVNRVFPQYTKVHRWLKENGRSLVSRLPQPGQKP